MRPSKPRPQIENKVTPTGRFRGADIIRDERKHLEPVELQAFFDQVRVSPFWFPYFTIQYHFGCRVSEPALILKEDVSLKDKLILLRRLKKRGGSGFREEVFPLSKTMRMAVRQILDWNEKTGQMQNPWLFPSPHRSARAPKERLGQIRRLEDGYAAISRMSAHSAFKAAAQNAGLPINLRHSHVLRHTRATLLLAKGYKPEHVKIILGHSNINTTYRYLGVAQDLREKLAGMLEDGADEISDHFFRSSARRTAELSRLPSSIQDSQFSAEPFVIEEDDL